MNKDKALDVLKTAILLEKRGFAFYTSAAEHAKNEDIKKFFHMMASEEKHHEEILSEQFKHYQKNQDSIAKDR